MVDYIDQHRQEFGVESICKVLPIAPSTSHDHKTRQPCARAVRDEQMKPVIAELFTSAYGARNSGEPHAALVVTSAETRSPD